MREGFALFHLSQAYCDFLDKPLVIINQTLDCFARECLRITTLLCGKLRKSGLQVGIEIDFHDLRVTCLAAIHFVRPMQIAKKIVPLPPGDL